MRNRLNERLKGEEGARREERDEKRELQRELGDVLCLKEERRTKEAIAPKKKRKH